MNFKFNYTCPHCNKDFSIDLKDFVEVTESQERPMGVEICHTVDYEGECPSCQENIVIYGDVWEYPEGTLNLNDTKIK